MGTIALTLTACASDPVSLPTSPPPPAMASLPLLEPQQGAAENQPFFDMTNYKTIATHPQPDGRAFIDGLTAAGFTKTDMQVTVDRTTVDLEADSLQFSVRMGENCLIGQWGPLDTGYRSIVAPVLGSGFCFVGMTRPIDW
jgi:hypothetical protein